MPRKSCFSESGFSTATVMTLLDRIYRAAVATMLGRAEYLRYLVVGFVVKINAAADKFPQDRIKRDFLGVHLFHRRIKY